jgi:ATP-dependent exoDNAse (exonuclease V) beta subunit
LKPSDEQLAAIQRQAPEVCVVAGPGSGKTSVLIERFAWLVEHEGIDPGKILAITFTEKAATEIKQRLVKRFEHLPGLREPIERAWAMTIDGFCTRLLLEYAIAANLPPDFSILDPSQASALKREAAEEALDSLFREQPDEMRRLLEAVDLSTSDDTANPDLAAALLEIYEAQRIAGGVLPQHPSLADISGQVREICLEVLRDRRLTGAHAHSLRAWAQEFVALQGPDFGLISRFNVYKNRVGAAKDIVGRLKEELLPALQAQWIEEHYQGLPALASTALERLDVIFRARKRQDSVLDFADLEEETIRLLESNESVRRQTQARFEYVLMDELQDTNRLQWRLVNLVRRKFFAVGDINQSIYRFRHADPSVFAEYRDSVEHAGSNVDQLNENHRSRASILETVTRAFQGQPGIEPRALIAKRSDASVPVEHYVGTGDDSESAEANLVGERIAQLIREGVRFGDIAVLVRTLNSTQPFEQAFDRFNIPFLLGSGRTFLEARETKDLLNLMAALVNPLDDIPLLGVLRGPFIGLSDEEIYRLDRTGSVELFESIFGTLRQRMGLLAPDRLLARAIDECAFASRLSPRSRANVDKFLAWLRKEWQAHPRPLAELLDDLEALRATRSEAEAPPPDSVDAVRMMSVHAAKGLEFPVVFLSAMHRRPDNRSAPMNYAPKLGIGWKWRDPETAKGIKSRLYRLIEDEEKRHEKEEENRLLYVAMTRAKDRLILSSAEKKQKSAWQKIAEVVVPPSTVLGANVGQAGSLQRVGNPPAVAANTPNQADYQSAAGYQPALHGADIILPIIYPSGQYDSTASITSISLFEACPRRYYLSRHVGLSGTGFSLSISPEVEPPGATEFGLAVHRALAGENVDSPAAQTLRERFEASPLGRRAARATKIEREFDFLCAIEDIVLRGQIDLWFEESGELILVDYKTGRDETRSSPYELQLRLYALALEQYAGRMPDSALLYYPRTDTTINVSLLEEDLQEAKKKVGKFREAQEGLKYPLIPGEQCQRCEFHHGLCPAP